MAYKDFFVDLRARAGSNLIYDGKFLSRNYKRFPVNSLQNCGYGLPPRDSRHKLITFSGTATPTLSMFQAMVGRDVDQTIWEWVPIYYPHWLPFEGSVAEGVQSGINAINSWDGKFGLSGYSQGAIVSSSLLWELRHGSLQDRYEDLIGAVMFGNPKREAGVTFPGGIDPGGAGMATAQDGPAGRIRNTPSWWYDFANSNVEDPSRGLHRIPGCIFGDPFAVIPLDQSGEWIRSIYNLMLGEFKETEYDLDVRLNELFSPEVLSSSRDAIQSILWMLRGFGMGHMEYDKSRPLPGSDLNSVEIGIQHLNTVGAAHPLTPQTAPEDPRRRAWYWDHIGGTQCGFKMAPTDRVYHFDVNPGDVYVLEAEVMPFAGNIGTTGSVQMGGTISDTNGKSPDIEVYIDLPIGSSEMSMGRWNSIKTMVTIPTGPIKYNQAEFWIRTTEDTNNSDRFWLDNVAVRENTSAAKISDSITTTLTGEPKTVTIETTDVEQALLSMRDEISTNTKAIQSLLSTKDSFAAKGKLFSIDFDNFATMEEAGFSTITYSGPGASFISIADGAAKWSPLSNSDRDAQIIYDEPTNTNFQTLRGTLASPPQNGGETGRPKFSAIGRVSEDGKDYIFARAYCDGLLSFKGELGCCVNGVETIWQSNISLKWSFSMTVACGIGTEERQYQVWSGNNVVTTYTEQLINTGGQGGAPSGGNYLSISGNTWKINKNGATGGTFALTYQGANTVNINWNATAADVVAALNGLDKGTWTAVGITSAGGPWYMHPPAENDPTEPLTFISNLSGGTGLTTTRDEHRKWGAIAQVRAGGRGDPYVSGEVKGCYVSDNETPQVNGSTAHMFRTGTGDKDIAGGSEYVGLPSSFFDNVLHESPDVNANTADGTFTVTISQPYIVTARIRLSGVLSALCRLGLEVFPAGGSAWAFKQAGQTFLPTGLDGIGGGQSISATWIQYLSAGDKVRLSTWSSAIADHSVLTGEETGTETYFAITGIGTAKDVVIA